MVLKKIFDFTFNFIIPHIDVCLQKPENINIKSIMCKTEGFKIKALPSGFKDKIPQSLFTKEFLKPMELPLVFMNCPD